VQARVRGPPKQQFDVYAFCGLTSIAPIRGSVATTRWLSLHHYTYWVSYQPVSQFWAFQGVAGAILIGLAALLVFATIRALARRTAH